MPYAPILTAYDDAAPCPRVEVFFENFAPGTERVTVYRSARGVEREVRGAVNAVTAGSLTRVDFECPFNVPVTYRAEMFDAGGFSLGLTDPATLGEFVIGPVTGLDVLTSPGLLTDEAVGGVGLRSDVTWIHNPLDPYGAVRIELAATTGTSISRPVPGEVSRPRGRRAGVVLAEPRLGVSGLQLDIRVSSIEAADKVQALIGTAESTAVPVVCVRLGGDETRLRVPQPLFLSALDIPEIDLNIRWGGGEDTLHRIEGDEADPPVPGLFIPLLTAADINAYFATAAAVNSGHLRAVDVNRRYDLAGFADQ